MDDLHVRIIIPLIAIRTGTEIGKVITPVFDLVASHATLVPDIKPIFDHGNFIIRYNHVVPKRTTRLITHIPNKEQILLLQNFQESTFEETRPAVMDKTG